MPTPTLFKVNCVSYRQDVALRMEHKAGLASQFLWVAHIPLKC